MIIHHTVPSKLTWLWKNQPFLWIFQVKMPGGFPYHSIPILVYLRVITAAGDKNLSLNNSTPFLQSASRASNGLCCSASPGVAANCCSLTKTETYGFASNFGSNANGGCELHSISEFLVKSGMVYFSVYHITLIYEALTCGYFTRENHDQPSIFGQNPNL